MMVLSTVEFNPLGSIVLHENAGTSDVRTVSRRLSRSATLDGGAVLDDAGFADGDITVVAEIPDLSETEFEQLRNIVSLFSEHFLSTVDGIYRGGVESLDFDGGKARLTFLVESKANG